MEFKGPYLQAMRERAPRMFNRLRRTAALEGHLNQKGAEAQRMYEELTADAPKLPNGLPEQPYRRQAEEAVLATLIEFPPEDGAEPEDPLEKLPE